MKITHKNISILVVDDEEGYRDLFRYMLEPMGISVCCVNDGLQALREIEKKPYDLILMDVHMPHMTGPEALRRMRMIRPEQKVVIFSSSSDPEYNQEKEVQKVGVECLFKPVDMEDIQRVLKGSLGVDFA